ncbi:MAG TPA: hypothetical protein P5567_06155 [Kiritimatiellia bacterium]|nr:hypothetical protein [Kiritimatiellia bacterium]HRZ12020.1 hypothetical protein [Kiritimatiellia bacterium]HSA17174.1 hypothetical protein [Kiritimatiellia bacterium]
MRNLVVAVAVCVGFASALAQVPSLINYQGRLVNDTNLVNETVGLSLQLYDDPSAGTLLYEDSNQVAVVDGLYSTFIGDDTISGTLTGALASAEVWIQVLINGAPLMPREQLVSAGYALQAADVPGNVFWRTDGNAGTTAGTHFVGTTDEQPLHLRADNATVLRLDGEPNPPNLIGGHASNYADPGVNGAFIGGGGDPLGFSPNRVSDHYGVVGGGMNNVAGDTGDTVSNSSFATVAGGSANTAYGAYSFIGGGAINQIFGASPYSVIAGGYNNIARGTNATVGGGSLNEARRAGATIAGGENNYAEGPYAFIGGGRQNKANDSYSFSAGHRAESLHEGSFVWADNSTPTAFASTSSNQFLIRAAGGVGINTNGPFTEALTVNGGIRATGSVAAASFAGDGSGLTMLHGTNLVIGSVSNAAIGADAVTGDKVMDGTITDDDVAANTFWQTTGNGGTAAGTHFVGTTDTQPLDLRANNTRVMRLDGNYNPPNVIGGSMANTVDVGVAGATIGGGGDPAMVFINRISDDYGFVGGGLGNRAGNSGGTAADAAFATVAGGLKNVANGLFSTIGGGDMNAVTTVAQGGAIAGGETNVVSGRNAFIGGGKLNAATGSWSVVAGGLANRAEGRGSAVGGGSNNVINSQAWDSIIAGGFNNRADENRAFIGGGQGNYSTGQMSVIAGGYMNTNMAVGAVIGGGGLNFNTGVYATVAGGLFNKALGPNAVIGGGLRNEAAGYAAVVAGGTNNSTLSGMTAIGGGGLNFIGVNAEYATIAGGQSNTVNDTSPGAVVGGGRNNVAGGSDVMVGGGQANLAAGAFSTIAGGSYNTANGMGSFIGGGTNNTTAPWAAYSVIAGGAANVMDTHESFMGGGSTNTIRTNAYQSAIVGGNGNTIETNAYRSVIVGGYHNTILAYADHNAIVGGMANVLGGSYFGFIGGGNENEIQGDYDVLVGGNDNYISSQANYAFIGGGSGNIITNFYGHGSFIGGGYYNSVSGRWSFVAGGYRNLMGGEYGVIAGGSSNVVNGDYAVVPGGRENIASAPYSFAAGRMASAVHTGAFVWADSTGSTFSSTTNDQFAIQASNGVYIAQDLGSDRKAKFGERFRDNSVVAWAKVDDDGSLLASFNVHTVTNAAVGRYDILLKSGARLSSACIPVATAERDGQPASAATVRLVSIDQTATNHFRVYINDGTFAPVNNEFTVAVFGR